MKLKILIVFNLLLSFYGFSQNTNSIDSLIHNSIKLKAFPGAQLYIKRAILSTINRMDIILMIQ